MSGFKHETQWVSHSQCPTHSSTVCTFLRLTLPPTQDWNKACVFGNKSRTWNKSAGGNAAALFEVLYFVFHIFTQAIKLEQDLFQPVVIMRLTAQSFFSLQVRGSADNTQAMIPSTSQSGDETGVKLRLYLGALMTTFSAESDNAAWYRK